MIAVFMTGLAMIGSAGIGSQSSASGSDESAFTCLSKGPNLYVATLAAGTQSPNEHAAGQATLIEETCRAARVRLEPASHVCLKMVSDNERLAHRLSQVYSSRMSVADFAAGLDAESFSEEDSDQQIEANQECGVRMSALQNMTMSGESQ
jgi:hypothetical protein